MDYQKTTQGSIIVEFITHSLFFGVLISLITYAVGAFIQKKTRITIFNPLLISIGATIGFLLLTHISFQTYYASARYMSYLLTPATICLAVSLYERLELLKDNWRAITFGIGAGVLTSLSTIFCLSMLFHLKHADYVTLLPKSITTAIGMGVSEELGGYVTLTVMSIIITGLVGNILAERIFKIAKISHPIARGVALGTSAHAVGTAKALELGETEGAMSGLSIAVAGLLTIIGASVFAPLLH
mgnify:FL=1